MFHAFVRGSQSWVEIKGGNPLTESYSVLGPEVRSCFDGTPLAQRNSELLEALGRSDALLIAGEASSHCVKNTLEDLMRDAAAGRAQLAKRVYVLTDCMSAVAVPDGRGGFLADFTEHAEQALERFKAAGMHLVKSTDPLSAWPGLYG
jgi:nicotinamidase-related amidase